MALTRGDIAHYCELVKDGLLPTQAAEELEIPYREIARRRRTDKAFAEEERIAREVSDEVQLGVVRNEIKARMLDRDDKHSAMLLAKEAMRLDPRYNERRATEQEKHAGIQIFIAGMLEPRVQAREVDGGETTRAAEVVQAARATRALPP